MADKGTAQVDLAALPSDAVAEACDVAGQHTLLAASTAAVQPAHEANQPQEDVDMTDNCINDLSDVFDVVLSPKRSSSRGHKGWAHNDAATSLTAPSLTGTADSATADDTAVGHPAAIAVAVPAVCVPACEFKERALLMFKVDAEAPIASGRPAVTPIVTKQSLQHAWWVANELYDDIGPQLSQAYGNFDRVVALGWLLGDVALGCCIEKGDAFKVGRKAGKLAPGLQAEFDAPVRRVGKRKHASDAALKDSLREAAEEAAATRCASVKLPFPEAPLPALPERVLPPAPPDAPPDAPPAVPPAAPSVEPLLPPLKAPSSERLFLLKALRAAEGAAMRADDAVASAKRERDRAQKAWDDVRARGANPRRNAQISEERWEELFREEMDSCREKLMAATRALGDAEMAGFKAGNEAREAKHDYDDYESLRWERERDAATTREHDARERAKDAQIAAAMAFDARRRESEGAVPEMDLEEYRFIHSHWNPAYDDSS